MEPHESLSDRIQRITAASPLRLESVGLLLKLDCNLDEQRDHIVEERVGAVEPLDLVYCPVVASGEEQLAGFITVEQLSRVLNQLVAADLVRVVPVGHVCTPFCAGNLILAPDHATVQAFPSPAASPDDCGGC